MNLDMNKVGNQIANLRKTKGLTQNEFGERLGVSFQTVSKLETSVDNILSGGELLGKDML